MSAPKAEKEGLALPEIVTGAVALALITIIVIIGLQILYYVMVDREVVRKTVPSQEYANLKAEQLGLLEGAPRWADQPGGKVAMGLEAATQAVVRRYGEGATAR
ncbi:hypothetical protein KDK88_07425 [bacterium]|nr:hypothetical protein [bacterium]HPF36340.1 hypothetical protein [Candidatus Krumholzibacteria bacterium]HRX51895.1 hypothetical protein [Candidatus Krumholzibacteria bacterium]